MISVKPPLPELFKGIALFTPGGDLIYCIDPNKQSRWHLHLCAGLQEILELPEPPHFLVPAYTATIDRWIDPQTQLLRTRAEVYPPVQRHQALLNAVFQAREPVWQLAPWPADLGDPSVLETYREQFPQLWEDHDLIVRFEQTGWQTAQRKTTGEGMVLRLFVSGVGVSTERILQSLHHLLEDSLHQPYTLKVIDIFKHPEQAEANHISATPTLIRIWPQPVRRIVGDLDNVERVLQILDTPESKK